MGIVGESGSGKSVASYALMGIIPDPGKVIGGSVVWGVKEVANVKCECLDTEEKMWG